MALQVYKNYNESISYKLSSPHKLLEFCMYRLYPEEVAVRLEAWLLHEVAVKLCRSDGGAKSSHQNGRAKAELQNKTKETGTLYLKGYHLIKLGSTALFQLV